MPRVVTDDDGREWIVATQVHLSDAAAKLGRVQAADGVLRAVSLGTAVVLAIAVLVSVPGDLWAPTVVYGPLLLALGMFLLWWAWRRPWSVTCVSADGEGPDPEVAWVYSPLAALQAVQELAEEHSGNPPPGRKQLDQAEDERADYGDGWFEGDWEDATEYSDSDWDGRDDRDHEDRDHEDRDHEDRDHTDESDESDERDESDESDTVDEDDRSRF